MLNLRLSGEVPPETPGIKLDELSLFDIAPSSITGDAKVQASIGAIDPQLRRVARNIASVLIYSRINGLPEPVIDTLAWQWHVDFYEPDLPLDVKRELVRNSIPWHRIKGTPAAVVQMVSAVFGNSWITEWFETAPRRRPYTFRLAVDLDDRMPDMDAAALAAIRRIVECTKNTRSFLELIELIFHLEDEVEAGDELSVLLSMLGYEDEYPYPQSWNRYDGKILYGGALHYDGRFLHDGAVTHSGVIPGWSTYGGSTIRIDDLYLALHTSFYDDVSEWSFTPEWGGSAYFNGQSTMNGALKYDGVRGSPFRYDGLVSYCGMNARYNGQFFYNGAISHGEFTRIRLTVPHDWFFIPMIRYTPEDEVQPADNNGILDINCIARYDGGVRYDGRASVGVTRYSGPLDGPLSVRRDAYDGRNIMDGSASMRHDALATAA